MKSDSDKEAKHLDRLIQESLFAQLQQIDQRLYQIEHGESAFKGSAPAQGSSSLQQVRTELTELAKTVNLVNQRAANMRLDRQILLTFKRLITLSPVKSLIKDITKKNQLDALAKERRDLALEITKKMTIESDVIVVCPAYPGGDRAYGGEFVQKRIEAYHAAGIKVAVIEVSNSRKELSSSIFGGVRVVRVNPAGLNKILRLSTFKILAAHSVEKPIWAELKIYADKKPIVIWVHGFEARNWKELAFNFSAKELETLEPRLELANKDRKQTMSEVFAHENVETIFVSNFMKNIAETFADQKAQSSHIIHNSINQDDFPYVPKLAKHRKKILWVRTFAAHNYSNDISRDVILELSKKPYFNELEFSIFGDGRFFDESVDPLRNFSNVRIERRFLSIEELREQHEKHGLMLVPSRWDSQGLTCGEAMSSGLVVLTNEVAGIPEFVDKKCGIVAPFEDVNTIVEGVDRLYNDDRKFLKMSKAAARRSAKQCGVHSTLDVEISLLSNKLDENKNFLTDKDDDDEMN
ncbi:glycosyltransferase family 4 protein [Hirschia maritima]|uniref:glycosyltransferase family 4 protein n=1 Tax=Hirschia maritima TaxID=1121961 RepID=UPI00037F0BEF|nr:glycosyltransferase family 4 protein [Hirschia maritima]